MYHVVRDCADGCGAKGWRLFSRCVPAAEWRYRKMGAGTRMIVTWSCSARGQVWGGEETGSVACARKFWFTSDEPDLTPPHEMRRGMLPWK